MVCWREEVDGWPWCVGEAATAKETAGEQVESRAQGLAVIGHLAPNEAKLQ